MYLHSRIYAHTYSCFYNSALPSVLLELPDSVYVCVCIWIYVCTHVCICACVCMCMYVYVCVCMCMHMYVRMHACIYLEYDEMRFYEYLYAFTHVHSIGEGLIFVSRLHEFDDFKWLWSFDHWLHWSDRRRFHRRRFHGNLRSISVYIVTPRFAIFFYETLLLTKCVK
jgi:hypothetical protein